MRRPFNRQRAHLPAACFGLLQQSRQRLTPGPRATSVDQRLFQCWQGLLTELLDLGSPLRVLPFGNVQAAQMHGRWVNYAERFTVDTRMLPPAALPDRIAVVDALASDRLADTGLPRERIVVTGTPLLDTWQSS
ncbi:MAG: hypothetical protein KDI56_14555, partial [Xanthomonadales bacterium]|nr:hypothetical protein [Xanthomonadales bacterium]